MSVIGCAVGRHLRPRRRSPRTGSAAGGDDRGGARIAARPHGERRIGDDDLERLGPSPCRKRQRQRQPGESAASDHDACVVVNHR
jgi:hypothetical protein